MIVFALRVVAALACFLMAMMAAGDATKAREKGKPVAFVVFAIFAMLFALSFSWVILA